MILAEILLKDLNSIPRGVGSTVRSDVDGEIECDDD